MCKLRIKSGKDFISGQPVGNICLFDQNKPTNKNIPGRIYNFSEKKTNFNNRVPKENTWHLSLKLKCFIDSFKNSD